MRTGRMTSDGLWFAGALIEGDIDMSTRDKWNELMADNELIRTGAGRYAIVSRSLNKAEREAAIARQADANELPPEVTAIRERGRINRLKLDKRNEDRDEIRRVFNLKTELFNKGEITMDEALDALLGAKWDAELEPFRYAGDGAPVRWLHQVI
jgi:hypothetical protein